LVEAHSINSSGEILALGKTSEQHVGHTSHNDVVHPDDCAPAPQATFLLIPTYTR
jgi:hypothetical protein